MREPCRVPFQHDADTCDCEPDWITITLRNSNLNAKARAETNSYARDALILMTIGMAAFVASFAGAAIVKQGRDNWRNVNLEYQETNNV